MLNGRVQILLYRLYVEIFEIYCSFCFQVSYLQTNKYGGAFVWSLDLDDFRGQFCNEGNYPFISHLHTLVVRGKKNIWSFYVVMSWQFYHQKCLGLLITCSFDWDLSDSYSFRFIWCENASYKSYNNNDFKSWRSWNLCWKKWWQLC